MNIGSVIKSVVKERRCSVIWLAEQMGCSRTNIYKIFHRDSINTDDLMKISRILKFDFFRLYSKELGL